MKQGLCLVLAALTFHFPLQVYYLILHEDAFASDETSKEGCGGSTGTIASFFIAMYGLLLTFSWHFAMSLSFA